MVQEEIIEFLIKRKNDPIALPDLCIALSKKANRTNISRACRKLRERGEIVVKPVRIGPFTKFFITVGRRADF